MAADPSSIHTSVLNRKLLVDTDGLYRWVLSCLARPTRVRSKISKSSISFCWYGTYGRSARRRLGILDAILLLSTGETGRSGQRRFAIAERTWRRLGRCLPVFMDEIVGLKAHANQLEPVAEDALSCSIFLYGIFLCA